VTDFNIEHEADSVLTVNISLIPQTLEMINHDSVSWEKLLRRKHTTIRLIENDN